jgi:hypothetical protein
MIGGNPKTCCPSIKCRNVCAAESLSREGLRILAGRETTGQADTNQCALEGGAGPHMDTRLVPRPARAHRQQSSVPGDFITG